MVGSRGSSPEPSRAHNTGAIQDRLVEYVGSIPAGLHLAELGCGSGVLTLRIAEARPDLQIVAIDPSTDRLRKATEEATHLEVGGRVRFERAELSCLPVSDGSVDRIVASRVLGPASNPSSLLAEIHRCLAFGGAAFIVEDVPESGAGTVHRGTLLPSLNRPGRDEESLRASISRSPFKKDAKLTRRPAGSGGSLLEIELRRPEPPERPPTTWRRP